MNCSKCSKPVDKCSTCKRPFEIGQHIRCYDGKWHYCFVCTQNAVIR